MQVKTFGLIASTTNEKLETRRVVTKCRWHASSVCVIYDTTRGYILEEERF